MVPSPAAAAVTDNVVLGPSAGALGLLHVFLPGTELTPGESDEYLAESARLGYHTIALSYPNSKAVGRYCRGKDACFGEVRREIVYGDAPTYDQNAFNSSKVDVPPDESIVGRLTIELNSRAGDPGWAQFLSQGRVDWSRVVVSGHSQGAGHAAILGIDQVVERVALLAGPNDRLNETTPPSWTAAAPRTPEADWFGLVHDRDDSKDIQLKSWDALFGPGAVTAAPVPTGQRRLVTTLSAADDRFHESVVVDEWLSRETDGDAALRPTWASLLNGSLGPPAATVATPTITPGGGNYPSPVQVTLGTVTEGATVRYTTDGSEPTDTSQPYSVPFTVGTATTVKARAFKSGLTPSAGATAMYTFGPAPTGPTFVSSTTANGVGTSITVPTPSGSGGGRLLLAVVRQKKTTGTVTPPGGWTMIREDVGSARSSLFQRVPVASEPAEHTFTIAAAESEAEAHMLLYSGVDTASPIADHGVGSNTDRIEDVPVAAPSLTPPVAGSTYVAFWSAKASGPSFAASSVTKRTDTAVNAALATGDQVLSTTSATGSRTATLSESSDRRIGQAVVLRPAGGTTTTTSPVTTTTTLPSSTTTTTLPPGGSNGPTLQAASKSFALQATALVIPRPVGVASGDLLLAALRQKKTTATVTAPTGWTGLRTDGTEARSSLYYRVATASEPTEYRFAVSVAADLEGHILRYSGVSTTSPVDKHALATNSGNASGTTVDAPSLVPTVAGTTYVAIWSSRFFETTVAEPAGMTERSESSGITTLATADQSQTGTSATGIRTATISAESDRRIGQAVLLRPAP